MSENESTDKSGMVTKPNQTTWMLEHGTPCWQGLRLSGIHPAVSAIWNSASPKPASASREPRTKFFASTTLTFQPEFTVATAVLAAFPDASDRTV